MIMHKCVAAAAAPVAGNDNVGVAAAASELLMLQNAKIA